MVHPIGQTPHLGVSALARVGAQGVGQADYVPKVSNAEPSRGKPHEPQRAKLGPTETSSPDPQNGQMMWRGLDIVRDGVFIAGSFVGSRSFVAMYLYDTAPTPVVL